MSDDFPISELRIVEVSILSSEQRKNKNYDPIKHHYYMHVSQVENFIMACIKSTSVWQIQMMSLATKTVHYRWGDPNAGNINRENFPISLWMHPEMLALKQSL